MYGINIKDFKGAIIQYTCEACLLGDNFTVEFSDVPKVKPGSCRHFNINFLLVIENNEFKYLSSLTCKNCKYNKMIELFNKNKIDYSGSIFYSCEKCGNGELSIGYLLQKEFIDLDGNEKNNNFQNKFENNIEYNYNKNKKINLIFSYNGQKFNVNVEKNILLPEAFHQLCVEINNKQLENLDIQDYKKGLISLSQFKTIEELNLNNGDIIDIEIRPYNGW